MSTDTLPVYDWQEPPRLQENDWDCSCESIEWCLYAWGRAPDDNWIENSMIAAGVVDPAIGCMDKSGAGLAAWLNTEYGEFGYVASNDPSVSFDDVAAEAGLYRHPLAMSGGAWYHWSGVRGYDAASDVIILANPAPGYQGVGQTMNRGQWAALGPWSMVRLTHPAAEGQAPSEPSEPALDYGPWQGRVGTGLLEMMQVDGVLPAQSMSTWLPLGSPLADIESCYAESGVLYTWLLTSNRGYRTLPA